MKRLSNGNYIIDKEEVKSFCKTDKEIRKNKEEKQKYIENDIENESLHYTNKEISKVRVYYLSKMI